MTNKAHIDYWNTSCTETDFERLFHHYYAPLCAYTLKIIKEKETSENIVQDVFLTLWEQRHKLNIKKLKAYLYKGVYHQALHLIEHDNVRNKFKKLTTYNPQQVPPPDVGLMWDDLNSAYKDELQKLPPHIAKTYLLNREKNLKYSEISELLNISKKTVESHISKALKAFRLRFESIIN